MKSILKIAQEVIAGLWGNGEERRQRLEAAGYDYAEVQEMVNAILSGEIPQEDPVEADPMTLEVEVDLNVYKAIKLIFRE